MKPWKTDVAVLLIFFVRDDTFSKVFESVRKARPRKLLLWQDGPRADKPSDIDGIMKCRKIAENIDWDCEVYKVYNDKNYGCDPSTFYADKWAFSIVDKCIVLEDDQMPSQSFFTFCKELLDKYENDTRISHICGYNTLKDAKWCKEDYLFSYAGSGAWASWKRVAENWDEEYTFLEDKQAMQNINLHFGKKSNEWIAYAKRHKVSGAAHWESIVGMGAHLQSQYAIIPKHNLVQNLGISQNATHSSVDKLEVIPKKDRQIYINEAQEIMFPLKHPKYVIPDATYDELRSKELYPSNIQKILRKAEYAFNLLKYGKFDVIQKRFLRKSR